MKPFVTDGPLKSVSVVLSDESGEQRFTVVGYDQDGLRALIEKNIRERKPRRARAAKTEPEPQPQPPTEPPAEAPRKNRASRTPGEMAQP